MVGFGGPRSPSSVNSAHLSLGWRPPSSSSPPASNASAETPSLLPSFQTRVEIGRQDRRSLPPSLPPSPLFQFRLSPTPPPPFSLGHPADDDHHHLSSTILSQTLYFTPLLEFGSRLVGCEWSREKKNHSILLFSSITPLLFSSLPSLQRPWPHRRRVVVEEKVGLWPACC